MHRSVQLAAVAASLALALAACPAGEDGGSASDPGAVERTTIEPFSYPAPVSGHLSEANAGEFDLVDGIAYPASEAGKGTVVFVSAKPIASPVLATSSCPATQARAVKLLRDASYVEVTLDADGRSQTFIYGSPYGGQGRGIDVGGGEWRGKIATAGSRAEGSFTRRYYGEFEFDLPLARTQPTEVSEKSRMAAGYAGWGGDSPVPTETEAITAYGLTRRAVLDGDLGAYLELQGFDAGQVEKIRGLAGIEDDFRAHGNRFLDPGAPEAPTLENGFAAVGARGKNSKGEAFANYYEFTPGGGSLILTSIGLNPQ